MAEPATHNGLTNMTSGASPSRTSSEGWQSSTASDDGDTLDSSTLTLTYTEAIAKGDKLVDLIHIPSLGETFKPGALQEWGYTTTTRVPKSSHPVRNLLTSILPSLEHSLIQIDSVHNRATIAGEKTNVPATDARFVNVFSLTSGLMVAQSNFGPAHTAPNLPFSSAHPQLQHWSDIVALQTRIASAGTTKAQPARSHTRAGTTTLTDADPVSPTAPFNNLRYVIRHDIENSDTNSIVHTILQSHFGSCSYDTFNTGCPYCCAYLAWPGLIFSIDSDEGLALLGTPNGRGVAWMLAQHEEVFGRKEAVEVRVWCDMENQPLRPSLLFCVEEKDILEEAYKGWVNGEWIENQAL
jgi:hypothetical protein